MIPDGFGRVARRHGDRGNLGLVPHFREEEEKKGRPEDAEALRLLLIVVVLHLVGNQNPDGHREEGDDEDPAQEFFGNEGGKRRAERARERVVEDRRKENAPDDGLGRAETRGEKDRKELRLVADFSRGDDNGGKSQGL